MNVREITYEEKPIGTRGSFARNRVFASFLGREIGSKAGYAMGCRDVNSNSIDENVDADIARMVRAPDSRAEGWREDAARRATVRAYC